MLNIDGKKVKIGENFDFNGFEKASSISQAYSSHKSDNITFSKKGSELKGTLYAKKYVLEQDIATCIQKMLAIKKEIGESKSGSREGQVENVENNMEYALPYDSVSEMTDDQKKLIKEHREYMYKHRSLTEDLKMVQTLLDNLEDSKTYTLSLEQMNTIQKGDIANEFPSYGDKQMTFSKTGKEIKEKLTSKRSMCEAAKTTLAALMVKLLADLKEKGHEPTKNPSDMVKTVGGDGIHGTDFPMFRYRQFEKYGDETNSEYVDCDESRKMMQQYNEACYKFNGVERDIKVIDIMLANMKDKQKYKLNIRQLATIEKGGKTSDNDINSLLTKAKGKIDKVHTVIGEFKDGTLKTSNGEKVTDKKQALAIALNSAKLSKTDFNNIQKNSDNFVGVDYDVQGQDGSKTSDTETAKSESITKAFDELGAF